MCVQRWYPIPCSLTPRRVLVDWCCFLSCLSVYVFTCWGSFCPKHHVFRFLALCFLAHLCLHVSLPLPFTKLSPTCSTYRQLGGFCACITCGIARVKTRRLNMYTSTSVLTADEFAVRAHIEHDRSAAWMSSVKAHKKTHSTELIYSTYPHEKIIDTLKNR